MSKLKIPGFIKRPNFKSKKTLALAVLVLVIIGTGGWYAFRGSENLKNGDKVYAQAAGHKIYRQEVRDLIGRNTYVSEHDAAEALADKYLTEALAKEQGISVTDKEIRAELGKGIEKQKKDDKYAYQNKVNQLYLDKLQAQNRGVYKGKLIITNFSQHIAYKPTLPEDKARDRLLGNKAAIAKDKKYAQELIDRLYSDITSGKISFDEAINIEHADSRVGLKAYPTLPHSGRFDTTNGLKGAISAESIRQKVNAIKAGETTKPFVVRTGDSLTDTKSTAETYFLIIRMDQTSGSYSGTDFKQYLEQAKKRLEYEVNV